MRIRIASVLVGSALMLSVVGGTVNTAHASNKTVAYVTYAHTCSVNPIQANRISSGQLVNVDVTLTVYVDNRPWTIYNNGKSFRLGYLVFDCYLSLQHVYLYRLYENDDFGSHYLFGLNLPANATGGSKTSESYTVVITAQHLKIASNSFRRV